MLLLKHFGIDPGPEPRLPGPGWLMEQASFLPEIEDEDKAFEGELGMFREASMPLEVH